MKLHTRIDYISELHKSALELTDLTIIIMKTSTENLIR